MPKIKFLLPLFITLMLISNSRRAFAAEESALDLEPIVITKDNPSFSLDRQSLSDSPANSLLKPLSALPLDLQSRGSYADIQSDFSLRGSSYQGVLLLLDNQRINDPQTGHHNSDLPLTTEDIEKVELSGTAIKIITRKPKEKKTVLRLGAGVHQSTSGLLSVSDKTENAGLRYSLENQDSAGFREDTDFKKLTTSFNSFLKIPRGEANFNLGYQQKEFGAYDFYTPGLGYPSKEWTKTYLLNSGLDLDLEGLTVKPGFLWRRHYDKFALDKTEIRSKYLNHTRTDIYTPGIYLEKESEALGNTGLGFEYSRESIRSTYSGSHRRNDKNISLEDNKDLTPKLSVGFSGRREMLGSFGQDFSAEFNLKYKLTAQDTLRLGLSKSQRLPSFTELYYDDPTTTGDPNLSLEKTFNYEAGYDYKKDDFSAGTTLFLRKEDRMIDWVKHSSGQAKWQAENVDSSDVLGAENYLRLRLNSYLTLDSNYTYINKKTDKQGLLYKYGPNYAKHLLNNVLAFDLASGRQTLELNYKKRPLRRGWLLTNLHLERKLSKTSQIFLNSSNLFNSEYQEIEGIPSPGRWVEIGMRFEF